MEINQLKYGDADIKINCTPFYNLDITLLYRILSLRQWVFIVEQNCPYLDVDGIDTSCLHVTMHIHDNLVAYTRIVPPMLSYINYSSIGRVVTHPDYRTQGLGAKIMAYSINKVKEVYPSKSIKISAQNYTIKFYEQLGFNTKGEEYLEDNIPHVAMIYE